MEQEEDSSLKQNKRAAHAAYMKQWRAARTSEQKARDSEKCHQVWANKTKEEREKHNAYRREKWANRKPEEKERDDRNRRARSKHNWQNRTPDQKAKDSAKRRHMWANTTPDDKQRYNENRRKKWANRTPEEKEIDNAKRRERRNQKRKNEFDNPDFVPKKKRPKHFIGQQSLENFIENNVSLHDVGTMQYRCSKCNSLMFAGEYAGAKCDLEDPLKHTEFSLCCLKGDIKLPPIHEPPSYLKCLLSEKSAQSQHFRDNIRAYNSSLAFASLGLTGTEYTFKSNGPYCFRINGQLYHQIGHLLPENDTKPKFSQIYIFDQANELENRMSHFKDGTLDKVLLKNLQDMLGDDEVSPFVKIYKHASSIIDAMPTADVRLILKDGKPSDSSKPNLPHNDMTVSVRAENESDPRTYKLPTGTEVAVIMPTDNDQADSHRDVTVYKNASYHPDGYTLQRISELHPLYDPLMYVLMFPYGDKGWCIASPSMMKYYRYRLMVHDESFNIIHRCGRLFQQYIVDMYSKIESNRLNYIRFRQSDLRAELYQGIVDVIQKSDTDVSESNIGKRVILPSSFVGSPRYQHQLYQDAMAIVRKYGKPDFFITFTCNPRWKEIKEALYPGQTPSDRPDLMARVFKLKLHELLQELFYGTKNVLGKIVALIYVIEWQKRGPPHAHILAISDSNSKPRTPEDIDQIVCAEIPDKERFPQLFETVTGLMLHGPCGEANRKSPCMVDGVCSKQFPKTFIEETVMNEDGYPMYRRRNDGKTFTKNGFDLDNRYVVPYNPYLSMRFGAHINVEVCSSVLAIKYLYKYVYKGPDMASVAIRSKSKDSTSDNPVDSSAHSPESNNSGKDDNQTDEIERYVNSRYVTASEGFWRICGFDLHGRHPSVMRLAVHEENQQTVIFKEGKLEEAMMKKKDTTLTAWFKVNATDPNATQYRYHEFPEHYVFKDNAWQPRKQCACIGRMYTTTPAQGERHYLRLLLHHIAGATCYEDLKRLPDGTQFPTFKETAAAMGLLEDDRECDRCMAEASLSAFPHQLRKLFVTILIFCSPLKPGDLWENHKDAMAQDIIHRLKSQSVESGSVNSKAYNEVLCLIQEELEAMNSSLTKFTPIPLPVMEQVPLEPRSIREERFDVANQLLIAEEKITNLNQDQSNICEEILCAIADKAYPQRLFFVSAPGGYGKTFLFETALASVRSQGKIALAVASSGIAAELLEGGRTSHSRFKIPIPICETSVCSISAQSSHAELIRQTAFIIWDECIMSHRHQLECVDRSLQDIMHSELPFGGIVTILGGDPRQILPVIRHGTKPHIIHACIMSSYLWEKVTRMTLTENMRVDKEEVEFSEYLLKIGNGEETTYPEIGENIIKIPQKYLASTVGELIERVFPNLDNGCVSEGCDIANRAILSPTNDYVDELNETIMSKFPGESRTYLSADSVVEEECQSTYPVEFLNSLSPSGMPPHKLTLKIGCPIIMLRNLSPTAGHGLRNGTRLIVTKLGDRVIEGEIATGSLQGKRVLIPRICLAPSDTNVPFTLRRCQFPVKPCFAMSINKSQGQSLKSVGVYLPKPVFSHGQLYVAFSRVRRPSALTVFVDNPHGYTTNVVYPEIL